jgi:hypothetical protein
VFRYHAFNSYVQIGRERRNLTSLSAFAEAFEVTTDEALDILSDGKAHSGIPEAALNMAVAFDVPMSYILYVPEDAIDERNCNLALHAVDMMIAEQRS